MADDLKKRFNTSLFSHFHFDYKRRMDEKAKSGQPVRFTDFFGMAIGDALLPVSTCTLQHQKAQKLAVPRINRPVHLIPIPCAYITSFLNSD